MIDRWYRSKQVIIKISTWKRHIIKYPLLTDLQYQIDPVYPQAEKQHHHSHPLPYWARFDFALASAVAADFGEMRADHCLSIRQYGSCQACPIAGLHHSDSVGRPSVFGWGGLLNYSIVNVHVTPKDEQAVLCVPTRTEWWSRSLRQTPFQASEWDRLIDIPVRGPHS